MTLSSFMAMRSLKDRDLAALLGACSEGAVRKWRLNNRMPRHRFLVRIKEVTGGLVTADDFIIPEGHPQ